MELNNKSIRGIFLYKPFIKFEKGDFVIEGGNIYIVKNNISGISPSEDLTREYYSIYLGDTIAYAEDFFNYANNTENDKLISARSIGRILNNYMSGFNEKGLIENFISEDGEIYIKDYCLNKVVEELSESYTDPLDVILVKNDLNNCVFAVSRKVTGSILGYGSEDTSYVILRQYTYKDTDSFVRIQELVDETSGNTWFRYSKSDKIGSFVPDKPWKSQSAQEGFLDNVNSIIDYYNNLIKSVEAKVLVDQNKFCFVHIPFEPASTSGLYHFNLNNDLLTTLTISLYKMNREFREVQSITVNVKGSRSIVVNVLGEDITIRLEDPSKRLYSITTNLFVDDIYGREIFK